MGHGHVTPNPDGSKARCGGPAVCPECALEAAALLPEPAAFPAVVTIPREVAVAADSLLGWVWHRYLTPAERESAGQAEYDKVISGLRAAYEKRA